MSWPVRFILNDQDISPEAPAGLLVLDYLRERERLTGTKEGCREGDCGACAVLIGSLEGRHVRYRAVTSCLMPIQELHGKHLVTIEGLRTEQLSIVQQAIVDEGASQCGFCTPGIVVSLTGHLMQSTAVPTGEDVKTALGGHLCRCTGYRSLKATHNHLTRAPIGLRALVDDGQLPAWFLTIPERLAKIPAPPNTNGGTVVIAGGTDLYVQRGDDLEQDPVIVLGLREDLRGVRASQGHLTIGAATTFEDLAESDAFQSVVPDIRRYMDDIASIQIRNRATVGGNLINASPIGDVTILLLALQSRLLLRSAAGVERPVPLASFYTGYKTMDRADDELLVAIQVERPPEGTQISWEKVSKRRTLDIASVNSALRLRVIDGVIVDVAATCGGVAAVPLRLTRTEAFLSGRSPSPATVMQAARVLQNEIAPIDDVRGTARYKRLLAHQLFLAHFNSLFPESISVEALDAEH